MMGTQETTTDNESISSLMAEHREILSVLAAFERWSKSLTIEGQQDRPTLKRFLSFFIEFADGCHHIKEERVLFMMMERNGFSKVQGPLAVMLAEHDQGRERMRALGVIAGCPELWGKDNLRDIRHNVAIYVDLLRNHISKEDQVLYPMAMQRLPPEAWQEIASSFADIEDERECAGQVDDILALKELLVQS